jgi:hypothetical protein
MADITRRRFGALLAGGLGLTTIRLQLPPPTPTPRPTDWSDPESDPIDLIRDAAEKLRGAEVALYTGDEVTIWEVTGDGYARVPWAMGGSVDFPEAAANWGTIVTSGIHYPDGEFRLSWFHVPQTVAKGDRVRLAFS